MKTISLEKLLNSFLVLGLVASLGACGQMSDREINAALEDDAAQQDGQGRSLATLASSNQLVLNSSRIRVGDPVTWLQGQRCYIQFNRCDKTPNLAGFAVQLHLNYSDIEAAHRECDRYHQLASRYQKFYNTCNSNPNNAYDGGYVIWLTHDKQPLQYPIPAYTPPAVGPFTRPAPGSPTAPVYGPVQTPTHGYFSALEGKTYSCNRYVDSCLNVVNDPSRGLKCTKKQSSFIRIDRNARNNEVQVRVLSGNFAAVGKVANILSGADAGDFRLNIHSATNADTAANYREWHCDPHAMADSPTR